MRIYGTIRMSIIKKTALLSWPAFINVTPEMYSTSIGGSLGGTRDMFSAQHFSKSLYLDVFGQPGDMRRICY